MTPRDPGTLLATTHRLDGGLDVRLRLTRPSDRARVREFLARLSPETRLRRFLTAMPTVPESVVRHFTFYEPRERLVIAATAPLDGGEEIIGLADLSLPAGGGVAEIGLVVEDTRQQRGVGKLLSEAIASLALSRGAERLKAETLDSNPAVLHLLRRLGPTVQTLESGRSVAYAKLPARGRRAA